jgi:diguanylate cyclase (GGDEF)-like protein
MWKAGMTHTPELEAEAATDTGQDAQRLASYANFVLLPVIVVVSFGGAYLAMTTFTGLSLILDAVAAGVIAALSAAFPIVMFGHITSGQQQRTNEGTAEHERQMLAEARRRAFETELVNALEMADGEAEVLDAVERALSDTLPRSAAEVLLADNSHAHLTRMVVRPFDGHAPNCPVDSPENCPAARRAQVQRFASSADLDACPKLRRRAQGECSAVCVPVSIMGRAVGVIHATSTPNRVVDDGTVQDLQTLANQAGARIGMLRIMAETQLQAATDSLTGLLNRRALENKVHSLRADGVPYAMAMADLDHFKTLNDTYGHDTGDRTLRLFAETLRGSLRTLDLVCRHGGEEFAIVLPNCSAADAVDALEQSRTQLKAALQNAGLPECTISIGVVAADTDEELLSTVERADLALFEAKRQGRDRIVVGDHNVPTSMGFGHRDEPVAAVASVGVDSDG